MMLEPFAGLRVVDLFAGSGALAIEALSRGAAHADLVESDPGALRILRANLGALELGARSTVWPLSLPQALGRMRPALAIADLVLADPPYGGAEARATLAALGERGLLPVGARVVVEHHLKDVVPGQAGVLARERERRYGETQVSVYRVGAAAWPEDQEAEA